MSDHSRTSASFSYLLFLLLLPALLLISSSPLASAGNSLPPAAEKAVLVDLKHFLLRHNPVNRGLYAGWNESEQVPCRWAGIACDAEGRVAGIDLRDSSISGGIFPDFYLLPALARLDLSSNNIKGPVPPELNQCHGLRYLNLSNNFIDRELNLTALNLLDTLDVSVNRFVGRVLESFPVNCGNLVSLNISSNKFTGDIGNYFDGCRGKLRDLDVSLNGFGRKIWMGFWWLREFLATDNGFTGTIAMESFPVGCSLETLDLSGNGLNGSFPDSIANCSRMVALNLWGNFFTGKIPSGIGLLSELNTLFIGNNSFDRELPVELLNCRKLVFLDLSRNKFRGEIQRILGNFTSLKILLLHSNSYRTGIEESGILKLPNLIRIDLSYNKFSRELPIAFAELPQLEFLTLGSNDFYGKIPPEYGRIATLQALDLSFNRLSGGIPPQLGQLTSLLWLMLGNNQLTGEIPSEIGNCSSLLWLNLANNRLSGRLPPEISGIGRYPFPTFKKNQLHDSITPGSGECLSMKQWLPSTYPPFSFVYAAMTRRNCRAKWDQLLKGYGVFPVCLNASKPIRTLDSTGYLQLSGNLFSGEIPSSITQMDRLSILNIENNKLSGELPPAIGHLPLILLNVANNQFSGTIPAELSEIQCLQILDLSLNNFSGEFPASLNNMSDLNKFNVSFNPLLHGIIPMSGQIATFDNSSFIGDPLMSFSTSTSISLHNNTSPTTAGRRSRIKIVSIWIILPLAAVIFLFGLASFILCLVLRSPVLSPSVIEPYPYFSETDSFLFEGIKQLPPSTSLSPSHLSNSSPGGGVKVFRLDKTAFTYKDIVSATGNFSADMIIGCGGSGVVYRGMLPDGRHVAVKKLRREGVESERAFRAEMEVLAGGHSNLVSIYGWCLAGSEKLLVYEYMEGGSLEDVIKDRRRFGWAQRMEAAVGVARALEYLHHQCVPAVVHRDVKASNVMMDGNGMAKVTDFGLARMMMNGETHVSTMVAGTVGYVAPEYGQTWRATTKGDVYSFGVLVMELATGRRAVEEGGEECLVDWLRRLGMEVAIEEVEGWEEEEGSEAMRGLMRVGMRCMEESPQDRPDMREVVVLLMRIMKGSDSDWDGSLDPPMLAR
ncbi:probable LRR receptor-like serine/threonine-protein kinase At1g74360 [Phalaenopsis equestris]|uniref:probable LRR receptor-like serine/threonine-protein kinase At1g74360 n=1 Tax=Phalaenopsis equestris TaxID=78828 RepID=UPI0009E65BAF|nr:probable LRR receptor-like serine/threonine-protein kinase At1g74360 [Phalaenopsis equestris]